MISWNSASSAAHLYGQCFFSFCLPFIKRARHRKVSWGWKLESTDFNPWMKVWMKVWISNYEYPSLNLELNLKENLKENLEKTPERTWKTFNHSNFLRLANVLFHFLFIFHSHFIDFYREKLFIMKRESVCIRRTDWIMRRHICMQTRRSRLDASDSKIQNRCFRLNASYSELQSLKFRLESHSRVCCLAHFYWDSSIGTLLLRFLVLKTISYEDQRVPTTSITDYGNCQSIAEWTKTSEWTSTHLGHTRNCLVTSNR